MFTPAANPAKSVGRLRRDYLDLHFPALGSWHPRPIGVPAHESAGWRAVGDEEHPERDVAFLALERGLAVLRADAEGRPGGDAERLHVLGVHGQRIDNGLVLRVILADIDLLALFAGAARI